MSLAHITWDKIESKTLLNIDKYITNLCAGMAKYYFHNYDISSLAPNDVVIFFSRCGCIASQAVKNYLIHRPNLKSARLLNISLKEFNKRNRQLGKRYTHPNISPVIDVNNGIGFEGGNLVPTCDPNIDI